MLKNRKLEVKLVKDDQAPAASVPTQPSTDYVAIANVLLKKVVVGTAIVIGTSVVMAAAKEIAICKLTHPNH